MTPTTLTLDSFEIVLEGDIIHVRGVEDRWRQAGPGECVLLLGEAVVLQRVGVSSDDAWLVHHDHGRFSLRAGRLTLHVNPKTSPYTAYFVHAEVRRPGFWGRFRDPLRRVALVDNRNGYIITPE